MTRFIPNALTLLNLLCGSIAVIFVINDAFVTASFFVFFGIFFDFFDGFAARKFKVQSALGVELDSLADMVTSGLVPGLVMYKLLDLSIGSWGDFGVTTNATTILDFSKLSILPLFGLTITLASAYRLAKFNVDDAQRDYFKGLPTPANTLLIIALPLIMVFQDNEAVNAIILNAWFLIGLTILSCYLLNSNIKLFALKFKDFSFKTNALRYIFMALCVVLLIVLQFVAIPVIIGLYIGLSVLDSLTSK